MKTRFRMVALLAAASLLLAAHNLLWFGASEIIRLGGFEALLARLPLLRIAGGAVLAYLGGWLLLKLFPKWVGNDAVLLWLARLLSGSVILAIAFVYRTRSHDLPIEWSFLALVLVSMGMLWLAWAGWGRWISILPLVLILGGAAIYLGFGADEDSHALMEAVAPERDRLAELRSRLNEVDASAMQGDLSWTQQDSQVLRLDERLSSLVQVEAPAQSPGAGVLYSLSEPAVLEGGTARWLDGVLHLEDHAADQRWRSDGPLQIPIERVASLRLRMKVSAGRNLRVHWGTAERFNKNIGIQIPIAEGEGMQLYDIREAFQTISEMQEIETIDRLYLTPSDEDAVVEIQELQLLDATASLSGDAPIRAGYQNVGGDLRHGLHTRGPGSYEFEVRIPNGSPRVDFSLLRVSRGSVAAAELSVDGVRLFWEELGSEQIFRDVRIDLSPWAGQSVRLRLSVRAETPSTIFWGTPTISGQPKPRPNVLLYVVDCLRAENCSAYGYERATTPQMERLAEEGVLFEHAFSNGCTTKLSMPSLFCSNPATATGVTQVHATSVLPEGFTTLPEILRAMGYATVGFTGNGNVGPYTGTQQGFERLVNQYIRRGETRAEGAAAKNVVEQARAWLAENVDRSFFLYVHTMQAHGPYDPPPPFNHYHEELESEGDAEEWHPGLDPEWSKPPTREGRLALYDGGIEHDDALLGSLLDELDARALTEDTIVIYTADHGEYLGEHERWNHSRPPYVQGTRIPLVIRWPGGIPAARRVDANVQLMDVMPTVLEAVGAGWQHPLIQGASLLAAARSETDDAALQNRFVYINSFKAGWDAVLFRRFFYLPERNVLFDLRRDPTQELPLSLDALRWRTLKGLRLAAREYGESYAEMQRLLSTSNSRAATVTPAVLEQLRALGYID